MLKNYQVKCQIKTINISRTNSIQKWILEYSWYDATNFKVFLFFSVCGILDLERSLLYR